MNRDQHGIGDAPIEDKYHRKMNALAKTLDEWFNGPSKGKDRKTGFVLMVFDFNESGRTNYISNADRSDVIALMKEQIARFEGQAEPKEGSA